MDAEIIDHEIQSLISNKEEEMKKIFYAKIRELKQIIQSKDQKISSLETNFEKLKQNYEFNYNLITERDNDLKVYDEKIESFEILLNLKDEEISKMKTQLEEMTTKFKNEKSKREGNEELQKFNISKIIAQHKDEMKMINISLENSKKESGIVKEKYLKEIEQLKYLHENDSRNLNDEIERLNSKIKKLIQENEEEEANIKKTKRESEEIHSHLNKINNENLILIKEKIHLENKLKIFEANESDNKTTVFLSNEKHRYIQKENEELRMELNTKNLKVDTLSKSVEDLNSDIHGLKQKLQMKDYELEKKSMNEKLLQDKLSSMSAQLEKLTEEKRSNINQLEDDKVAMKTLYETKIRKLIEENASLKEENENLNKKIKDLMSLNIKESKEKDNDDSLLDFFNKKSKENIGQGHREDLNVMAKEKERERECERLKKECEGAKELLVKMEEEMSMIKENFKVKEDRYIQEINGYKDLIAQVEEDLKRADDLYRSREEKIKLELLKKELELKNNAIAINASQEKDGNKSKQDIADKEKEIKQLKEKLAAKLKEITRLKDERDKLAKLCSNLRAEVNRLENMITITGVPNTDQQYYDHPTNFQSLDERDVMKSIQCLRPQSSSFRQEDIEELKHKKNLILNNDYEGNKISIKDEAKKTILTAMEKNCKNRDAEYQYQSKKYSREYTPQASDDMKRANTHTRLRNAHINSRSRSGSRSISPKWQTNHVKSPQSLSPEKDDLTDLIQVKPIEAPKLKLIKRTKNNSHSHEKNLL